MYRVLLIAVLLCIAELGLAKKKINLHARARYPIPPIEVSIDGKVLEFELLNDVQILDVLIEDASGNIVFSSSVHGNFLDNPFELDLEKGIYTIIITCNENIFWGDFSIDE